MVVKLGDRSVTTNAILDSCSSVTFGSEKLYRNLNARCERPNIVSLDTATIHGERELKCKLMCNIKVYDLHQNYSVELPPVYTIKKIPVDLADVVKEEDIDKWEHLRDLRISPLCNDVDLLIGLNAPAALEPMEVCHAPKKDDPFAIRTRRG